MIPHPELDRLKRQRPEWTPWLAVVEGALRETTTGQWDEAVPVRPAAGRRSVPLLSGATVNVKASAVRQLLRRLIDIASRADTSQMSTLRRALDLETEIDPAAVFSASLSQDSDRLGAIAAAFGTDRQAFEAVVALVAVPFLQACNRKWAREIPNTWLEGYCPVCGAWPAFAEVRGIERTRHLRCGRCGGEWHAHILHCAFCDNSSHDELTTLVPETAGTAGVIEACRRCHGYVKTMTRLQGCAPNAVMLEDLGTVALDVAALEQGYTRPAGTACTLDVNVNVAAAGGRFFAWNV